MKKRIRFISILLSMLLLCTAAPLQLVGAAEQTTDEYKNGVIERYEESFENSSYYHSLLDQTMFQYKDWSDDINGKDSFTKAYLWSTNFMMDKLLDTNAYVDYLSNLLAMMETSFAETSAAQASYTAKVSGWDVAKGAAEIACSDLLGGRYEKVKATYELVSGGLKFSELGIDAIKDINQLAVYSTACVSLEQKLTVLEAIRDHTEDEALKKAADDMIHVCNMEFIYICDNYSMDMAAEAAKFDYNLMGIEPFKNLMPYITRKISVEFVPWLTKTVGKKAGSAANSVLIFAGKLAKPLKTLSYAGAGFKIGLEIMKVAAGNKYECYREMLAMNAISDALYPALKEAKDQADTKDYDAIRNFTSIAKALTLTHLRGDYCNVECRTGDKKDGADKYYGYLLENLTTYESAIASIFEPEETFVVHDTFELYNNYIVPVAQKTEVPEGYIGIYSYADFQKIKDNEPKSSERKLLNEYNCSKFILMDNITCPDGYESIVGFGGVLDGNGYAIYNVTEPLFELISGAEIRNLGISLGNIKSYNDSSLDYGGLAKRGAVSLYGNLYRETSIVDNCYTIGTVDIQLRQGNVGGLIGDAFYVEISNCYNEADIKVNSRQGGNVGGIVGNSGMLSNCYNSGNVETYATTANTFNEYSIDVHAGGISGQGSLVSYSYNNGNVSGGAERFCDITVGGVVGNACDTLYSEMYILNSFNAGSVKAYSGAGVDPMEKNPFGNGIYAGGVAGRIDGVSSKYAAYLLSCWNGGNVSGETMTGGISAAAYQYVITMNCFNTGTVTGENTTGGLFGCIMENTTVSSCYNSGMIAGGSDTGSLAGDVSKMSENTFENCYYLDNGIPSTGIGDPEGTKWISADQMKSKDSYDGFNFSNIWKMDDESGISSPVLRFKDTKTEEK